MRGWARLVFVTTSLVVCAGAGNARAQDDRSDACGYVYAVDGYQAEIGDLRISLPANDRLVVNGRVVAEHTRFDASGAPTPWEDSANGARIGFAGENILILTTWSDCVDYAWQRIYVLTRTGELRTTSALWSVHDRYYFVQDTRGGLTFLSDWFCDPRSGAPAGQAYVQVLRANAREFVREVRPRADVCDGSEARAQMPVYFSDMQPVIPPP